MWQEKLPPRTPSDRPEDAHSFDFEGPSDLNNYHEAHFLSRLTVAQGTLDVVCRHYPAIEDHLPLRLLLQYLLFNRHAIHLNSAWDGEGSPLPAKMLAWMAGRTDQYDSNNFRAEDLLWWARDELFGSAFVWTDWKRGHAPRYRKYRRVHKLELPDEIVNAVEQEMSRSARKVEHRVWFDSGNKYTRNALDLRSAMDQTVSELNEQALDEKGNPDVPSKIKDYLNDLPVHGFNQIVRDHIEEAYAVVEERISGPQAARQIEQSKRHARMVLRHIDDRPKPRYRVKRNTQRLYAPQTLQQLNSEVREILTQDWIELDLKSAHLAICARLWDISPLLEFLDEGGDIWEVLIPYMGLPKAAIKKALYALTYGASVYGSYFRNEPPTLQQILGTQGNLSESEAKEACSRFAEHHLINPLYEARKRRLSDIKKRGFITDAFGYKMELGVGDGRDNVQDVTSLTLLMAEVSAVEMMLLWPAFEEVIGNEKYCKIMLYTFDGIHVKPMTSDQDRIRGWIRKLQGAVDEKADHLGIPTTLEME